MSELFEAGFIYEQDGLLPPFKKEAIISMLSLMKEPGLISEAIAMEGIKRQGVTAEDLDTYYGNQEPLF